MRVFKFGGASIKDAEGVRNLVNVFKAVKDQNTLIVVSAMGKTTNALEKIIEVYFKNKKDVSLGILSLKEFHLEIIKNLFQSKNIDCET